MVSASPPGVRGRAGPRPQRRRRHRGGRALEGRWCRDRRSPRHDGVDRRGRRADPQSPALPRDQWECRPYRSCRCRAGRAPVPVRRALAEGWQPDATMKADGVGLAASAAAGNSTAIRNIERAGRAVGVAIASCANLLDLEMVAIGGGFSQSGPPFWDALHEAFAVHARMDFAAACQVVAGKLGGDAPLLGAAAFILDADRYGWDIPTPPRPLSSR